VIPITAIGSIVIFFVALDRLRIAATARTSIAVARTAGAAVTDPTLDDRSRERAARQAAVSMAAGCAALVVRTAAAEALSVLPICVASWSGIADTAKVVAYLSRWQTMLAAAGLTGAAYLLRSRVWPAN